MSAQKPVYVPVPEPDIFIDGARPVGEDLLTQRGWADQGVQNANNNPIELPQVPQGFFQMNQENLYRESRGVAFREEVKVLSNDDAHLESDDASYGDEICRAIEYLDKYIGNLNDLNQVVTDLHQLASYDGSQAPDDLAGVIGDATATFEQAFGCIADDLDTTQWIIQQIQALFCPNQG